MLIGNLKDRPLPQLLYQIHAAKATGTLMVTLNELRKAILFDNGRIISAYSNLREDSLGEVLLRSGAINVDEYLETEKQVKQGKRFGQILLENGKITQFDLSTQMSYQVLSIIYSLFVWQIGYFEFADNKLPQKDLPDLDISTLDIILRGVKLIRSWEQIRKTIDSLDDELEPCIDWETRLKQLQLSKDELAVFHMIEPGVTIRDISLLSNLNSFETCRLLMGFLVIELVQKRGMPSWVLPDELS
ncbi:MAG: DUF4388 domain-containing protein [Blastocatellia bacterium]|nr:DUF4388 domain-containing protein [Blastocatellia bacterium]